LIFNGNEFIKQLFDMNKGLEMIQKSLRDYLEGKRGQFPRFYFLSNDDLLEIIGQGKDPTPINKHIKKVYEGINQIAVEYTGKGQEKVYSIKKIIAPDGEVVELENEAVKTNIGVEFWLEKLTVAMQTSLKKIFQRVHTEYQGQKRTPDKESMGNTITKNQGQILITMAQIEWTRAMKDALRDLSEKPESNSLKKVKKQWQ
jgi:dynein heavy chain, axonemal